jgi:hypothetical protein
LKMKIKTTKTWIVRCGQSYFRIIRGADLAVVEVKAEKALVEFAPQLTGWIPMAVLKDRTNIAKEPE